MNKAGIVAQVMTALLTLAPPSTVPAAASEVEAAATPTDTLKEATDSIALIITGILVGTNEAPIADERLEIFFTNSETTIKTTPDSLKKPGLGPRIEGSGTLAGVAIVGTEVDGAYKLIDGVIVNPGTQTDGEGRFTVEVAQKVLAGETGLILTVSRFKRGHLPYTENVTLVDEEGTPILVKLDRAADTVNLGKVSIFRKP